MSVCVCIRVLTRAVVGQTAVMDDSWASAPQGRKREGDGDGERSNVRRRHEAETTERTRAKDHVLHAAVDDYNVRRWFFLWALPQSRLPPLT